MSGRESEVNEYLTSPSSKCVQAGVITKCFSSIYALHLILFSLSPCLSLCSLTPTCSTPVLTTALRVVGTGVITHVSQLKAPGALCSHVTCPESHTIK